MICSASARLGGDDPDFGGDRRRSRAVRGSRRRNSRAPRALEHALGRISRRRRDYSCCLHATSDGRTSSPRQDGRATSSADAAKVVSGLVFPRRFAALAHAGVVLLKVLWTDGSLLEAVSKNRGRPDAARGGADARSRALGRCTELYTTRPPRPTAGRASLTSRRRSVPAR